MYIYLCKVKQYLEIKLDIFHLNKYTGESNSPSCNIATCVMCKIYREQKQESEVPAIVHKNHNIIVCLTLIKVF